LATKRDGPRKLGGELLQDFNRFIQQRRSGCRAGLLIHFELREPEQRRGQRKAHVRL
jgi:hypothetical protein